MITICAAQQFHCRKGAYAPIPYCTGGGSGSRLQDPVRIGVFPTNRAAGSGSHNQQSEAAIAKSVSFAYRNMQ
jgi:hypothetical protein